MIILLGLGPGDPALLTREAWSVLQRTQQLYLRTRRHPTVDALPDHLTLHSFDATYDEAEDFERVYRAIADAVLAAAERDAEVVYAVPGHPLVGEATSSLILAEARQRGISVRVVAGVSFVESTLQALAAHPDFATEALDPLRGLQVHDALELATAYHPPLNPDQPALIAQVYSRLIASDVKLTLMNQYAPQHPVWVVRDQQVERVPLHELDHAERFDHLTTLYVPPTPQPSSFEALQAIVAHLRAPEGCPWDREQTHESLRATLLEEAYEVLSAIDAGDWQALKEELGDLLLNVVMQAQIATESETFRMGDSIAHVIAKLKRRHPHVFGDVVARTADEVLSNWHAIKQHERAQSGETSALDGVPVALPALAQAQMIIHRAKQLGFRWHAPEMHARKVREELEEVARAADAAQRTEELGDLIFAIAGWAESFGVDLESAVREANQKFARRFRALERLARERGLTLGALSLDELLALWREAKAHAVINPLR
ncbi:MAG: nucleoside triphosphate pyrophosphohydrolase [Thermoflexales bacterium]|nr:nucleoside triphosphate pyrophosphohydrolase [Thermoflexales bacterium]MDW8292430.1 nucleoside triphosphate pyrophosphohydrolase [Anaerolineae bacterium]